MPNPVALPTPICFEISSDNLTEAVPPFILARKFISLIEKNLIK